MAFGAQMRRNTWASQQCPAHRERSHYDWLLLLHPGHLYLLLYLRLLKSFHIFTKKKKKYLRITKPTALIVWIRRKPKGLQKFMTYIFGFGNFPPFLNCLFAKQHHRHIVSVSWESQLLSSLHHLQTGPMSFVQNLPLLCLLLFFTDIRIDISACFFRKHFCQRNNKIDSWAFWGVGRWEMPAFSTLQCEIGLIGSIDSFRKTKASSSVHCQCFCEALAFRLPLLAE